MFEVFIQSLSSENQLKSLFTQINLGQAMLMMCNLSDPTWFSNVCCQVEVKTPFCPYFYNSNVNSADTLVQRFIRVQALSQSKQNWESTATLWTVCTTAATPAKKPFSPLILTKTIKKAEIAAHVLLISLDLYYYRVFWPPEWLQRQLRS